VDGSGTPPAATTLEPAAAQPGADNTSDSGGDSDGVVGGVVGGLALCACVVFAAYLAQRRRGAASTRKPQAGSIAAELERRMSGAAFVGKVGSSHATTRIDDVAPTPNALSVSWQLAALCVYTAGSAGCTCVHPGQPVSGGDMVDDCAGAAGVCARE